MSSSCIFTYPFTGSGTPGHYASEHHGQLPNYCNKIFVCAFQIDILAFHAMLTDFGLAKVMTLTAQVGTKTMLAGSPGFQPPEQLRAHSVGIESDVYAFGEYFYGASCLGRTPPISNYVQGIS